MIAPATLSSSTAYRSPSRQRQGGDPASREGDLLPASIHGTHEEPRAVARRRATGPHEAAQLTGGVTQGNLPLGEKRRATSYQKWRHSCTAPSCAARRGRTDTVAHRRPRSRSRWLPTVPSRWSSCPTCFGHHAGDIADHIERFRQLQLLLLHPPCLPPALYHGIEACHQWFEQGVSSRGIALGDLLRLGTIPLDVVELLNRPHVFLMSVPCPYCVDADKDCQCATNRDGEHHEARRHPHNFTLPKRATGGRSVGGAPNRGDIAVGRPHYRRPHSVSSASSPSSASSNDWEHVGRSEGARNQEQLGGCETVIHYVTTGGRWRRRRSLSRIPFRFPAIIRIIAVLVPIRIHARGRVGGWCVCAQEPVALSVASAMEGEVQEAAARLPPPRPPIRRYHTRPIRAAAPQDAPDTWLPLARQRSAAARHHRAGAAGQCCYDKAPRRGHHWHQCEKDSVRALGQRRVGARGSRHVRRREAVAYRAAAARSGRPVPLLTPAPAPPAPQRHPGHAQQAR